MLTIVERIPYGHRRVPWPLPNVWLGVSAERQQEADERIPELLNTPAAIRFISAEPLLGQIDLSPWLPFVESDPSDPRMVLAETPVAGGIDIEQQVLDWVIAGGESGRQARAMHPNWARALRDQCAAAGVPFFFKQWGEWAPSSPEQAASNPRSGWQTKRAHPCVAKAEELYPEAGAAFVARVGKKAAGRLLDGKLHNEFPTTENLHGV
jgi:protein gp37